MYIICTVKKGFNKKFVVATLIDFLRYKKKIKDLFKTFVFQDEQQRPRGIFVSKRYRQIK